MTTNNEAAVLYGVEDIRIEQRLVPSPAAREVLVAIRSVGVCGSDVHYYRHGRIGDFVVRSPLILGHESSGVVVDVGTSVTRTHVGQRVALEPGVPCGHCAQCRSGRYNLCPHVQFFATPPIDGTFTNYVNIDEDFAHPVPDALSDDAAALLEPLSVAIWANRKAGVSVGSHVLVTGAGPIGILAAQVAAAAGAARVTIVDINSERLATAQALGVEHTMHRPTESALCTLESDVLLECSGAPSVISPAIRSIRPAGVAILTGMSGSADISLPVAAIQSRELTVTGTFRYANTYAQAIALATSAAVNLDALVGLRLPLAAAEDALRAATTHPAVLKTIVTMQD